MQTQNLKLDYIENGRLSNGEMIDIYGGLPSPGSDTILCGARVICYENGLSSCIAYFKCSDINDEYSRNTCGTYFHVMEVLEDDYFQK